MRDDAEVHLANEHDQDDEMCPIKLYDRAQAVYDDARLFGLLRSAPQMREHLQHIAAEARASTEGDEDSERTFQKIFDIASVAIAEAT